MLDITSKTNFYYFGLLQLNGQEREQCWQRSHSENHCARVLGALPGAVLSTLHA